MILLTLAITVKRLSLLLGKMPLDECVTESDEWF